ncbi:MAG: class I SAM-dependent methyltransferase [Candidatus Peribacteraceae bacterium]|nr:class I SAM-dependent methyltransferase [Candidatus Peribacteraceae bacterium]
MADTWQIYQDTWERHTRQDDPARNGYTAGDIERCKVLMNMVGIQAGRILDVGCGNGWFRGQRIQDVGIVYIDPSNNITGLDPANENDEDRFPVKHGYGEDIPYDNGTFAAVVARSVLDHVKDHKKVMAECHRVLQDGGKFYGETAIFAPEHTQSCHIMSFRFHDIYSELMKHFKTLTGNIIGSDSRYCHFLWEAVK